MTVWLDEGVKGDVLQIFTTIDEGEAARLRVGVGGIVIAIEGVGAVICNVVVVLANGCKDVCDKGSREFRDAHGIDIQEKLVEEGRRCPHDVTGIVEAAHTLYAREQFAVRKVGAKVFDRDEAKGGWIPGSEFEWIKLKDSGIARDQEIAGSTPISYEDWERGVALDEIIGQSYRGPGVGRTTVGCIDQLEGQSATPVIGDGSIEASVSLVAYLILNGLEVARSIEQLYGTFVGTLEDGLIELPDGVRRVVE